MDAIDKDCQVSGINIKCPYCGKKTLINAPNDFNVFYTHCVICNEKFVVEPVRNGITVYTLADVPYSIDPDCQAIEMGQSDEE